MQVNIDLLKHQRKLLASNARLISLVSGYGGGKTLCGCLKTIIHSMTDPAHMHLVVSPTTVMAKKTVIPTIKSILMITFGLRRKQYSFNKTDGYFYIPAWNGHIYIVSADKPDSLRGPNVASIYLDEAGQSNHEVYLQLISRLREPKAKQLQMWMAGTPDGLGFFYDITEGKKKPKDLEVIRAKTTDNFFLPQSYIDSLYENFDAISVMSYINGEFVNLTGAMAYHAFSDKNVIKMEDYGEPDPDLPLVVAMDFNWNPNTAVIGQVIDDWEENGEIKQKFVVFDEIWVAGETETKCQIILDKYGDAFYYELYMDASAKNRTARQVGSSDINIIRNCFKGVSHRIFIKSANPKRIDRLNAVNAKLNNSKNERFILITDNCVRLIEDLRKCTRDEFLLGKYKDPDIGHISDSIGYYIEFKYPIKRAISHSQNEILQHV